MHLTSNYDRNIIHIRREEYSNKFLFTPTLFWYNFTFSTLTTRSGEPAFLMTFQFLILLFFWFAFVCAAIRINLFRRLLLLNLNFIHNPFFAIHMCICTVHKNMRREKAKIDQKGDTFAATTPPHYCCFAFTYYFLWLLQSLTAADGFLFMFVMCICIWRKSACVRWNESHTHTLW